MSLITLIQAKDYLDITDTDSDATIQLMIDAITPMFEKAARRKIEGAVVTEIVNGTGNQRIWLKEQPETVTSVIVSVSQAWSTTAVVDATTYFTDEVELIRTGSLFWTEGFKNIQIVYEAGFSVANIPADIWWGTQKTIQKMWSTYMAEKGYSIDVVSQDKKNDKTMNFRSPKFLDQEVIDILENYAPWPE